MTDPALIGHLRILEAKLDRLTEAIDRVAKALERDPRLQPDALTHIRSEVNR